MLLVLAYELLRRLVALAARPSNPRPNEVEALVLRHQLSILRRQVGRPRLRHRDRLFVSALSRVLPRDRWSSFLLRPQTLLRRHRELVRRNWTYRHRSLGGRPQVACVQCRGMTEDVIHDLTDDVSAGLKCRHPVSAIRRRHRGRRSSRETARRVPGWSSNSVPLGPREPSSSRSGGADGGSHDARRPERRCHLGDVQARGVVSQAERDARGVVESVGGGG
jgi:hypothetical protein